MRNFQLDAYTDFGVVSQKLYGALHTHTTYIYIIHFILPAIFIYILLKIIPCKIEEIRVS